MKTSHFRERKAEVKSPSLKFKKLFYFIKKNQKHFIRHLRSLKNFGILKLNFTLPCSVLIKRWAGYSIF